jgi:hypothetical protein
MTPWERMVLGVGLIYVAFKAATGRRLSFARTLGYWALWPGMDARPFGETRPPAGRDLMAWGALKMALGAALLGLRTGHFALDLVRVFAGIGFLVHFGICDVLAGFWRLRGVAVERLFVNPAASRSLGEFWGRRWNLAFHAVVRELVFRPAARQWGAAVGVLWAFLFSGVLHEALLSLPPGGGYGLPTTYFMIQAAGILAERRWPVSGRLWTLGVVLVPSPLLFHPWFVKAIILPLL